MISDSPVEASVIFASQARGYSMICLLYTSYLKDLGVDVIWLSPVYQSPNEDVYKRQVQGLIG